MIVLWVLSGLAVARTDSVESPNSTACSLCKEKLAPKMATAESVVTIPDLEVFDDYLNELQES